jgi:transcription antitermination factor NusG
MESISTVAQLEAPIVIPPSYLEVRWYAVWTRSRHEKAVSEQLEQRSVETFLPLYETVRQWRNGRHRVQLPLFPGYAFVHIALKDRLEVLKTPGVVRLVGFNGTPHPLANKDIERLREALTQGVRAEPHPFLTIGRRVRIAAGPLAGCEGVLVRRKGRTRVVLSIAVVQRSIIVDVDVTFVNPIFGSSGPESGTESGGNQWSPKP